jgi:uncharacterized protein (TIGR02679 family)
MDANDCATYFRERPVYKRMLREILRKYQGLGRLGGQVCLSDATEDECQAARALFGCFFSPPLKFKLQEFEDALQSTPYQGISLPGLLEAYFGSPILTRQEERHQKEQSMAEAIMLVHKNVDNQNCRRWLHELMKTRSLGYKLVQKSLASGEAATVLTRSCLSLDWIESHPGQTFRLAVLSAQVTSDPHALDSNTTAGKLLLHLLAFREGTNFPSGAEQRISLYYRAGILCDSISSSVTQTGLVLYIDGEEHPAFREFRLLREVCTLTLTNLARVTDALSPSGRVYMVENQMVFSQLCEHTEAFHSPLICTSGQPQVAVFRLIDLLVASGTKLFYSGDFDGGGLSIAERFMVRYPHSLVPWHMEPEDYATACSHKKLERAQLRNFGNFSNEALACTAAAILKKERAGYQELLLPLLLKDLTETP